MLTIQKTMNKAGYDIRIKEKGMGRGSKPTYCATPQEITSCIAHYYGDDKNHNKETCPFCRNV